MKSNDWYDYPEYWEMAFAEDTPLETKFIEAACKKYVPGPLRRMFEPGCGSGRLVVSLARRGYHVVGFDLNQPSLEFLRKRIARGKLPAEALSLDMTDFTLDQPCDAAFCTFSTFRHLPTEEAAEKHLQSVARNLRSGGIYVLGLHLVPPDASDESCERWRAEKGKTRVFYTLTVIEANRRRRYELMRATMRAWTPRGEIKLRHEFKLRLYNATQMRRLLASAPEFELCDVFDFNYDLDHPLKLNNELSDTILILRKK